MSAFEVAATDRSPRVLIDRERSRVEFEGESYPENVVDFYAPVIGELRSFLQAARGRDILAVFKFKYFNSSSAKVIFNMVDLLDVAGESNTVVIKWFADAEDDVMIEFGEDLQDDVDLAEFEIVTS